MLVLDCSLDYSVLSLNSCVGSLEIRVLILDIGSSVGRLEGIGFVAGKVINIK